MMDTTIPCCPSGHPWTPENTARYQGRRRCRECARLRSRAYYERTMPPLQGPPKPAELLRPARVATSRRAGSLEALKARTWPLRLHWPPTRRGRCEVSIHAVDLSTPGATEPISRATLRAWSARGWVRCTERRERGPFGCWERYELTGDAG